MNFAGQPLLSRQTLTAGRSLFLFSFAVFLTIRLDLDTSMMEVFDIPVSREIQSLAAPIGMATIFLTLLVHWLGDVASLGPFNVSMKQKTDGLVFGQVGNSISLLESLIQTVDGLNELDPAKARVVGINLERVQVEMKSIQKNMLRYHKAAWVYVYIWSFGVPSLLAVYAAYLITHA